MLNLKYSKFLMQALVCTSLTLGSWSAKADGITIHSSPPSLILVQYQAAQPLPQAPQQQQPSLFDGLKNFATQLFGPELVQQYLEKNPRSEANVNKFENAVNEAQKQEGPQASTTGSQAPAPGTQEPGAGAQPIIAVPQTGGLEPEQQEPIQQQPQQFQPQQQQVGPQQMVPPQQMDNTQQRFGSPQDMGPQQQYEAPQDMGAQPQMAPQDMGAQ